MATKNFTQFSTAAPLTTSDYIVGYNAAGTAELKATVQQIVDLVSDSDSQTLSFNEGTKDLSISSGNTVSLSSFITDTTLNSVSSLLTPLTLTNTLTGQLVLNTDFNSYKTDVASATGSLVKTTDFNNYKTDVASATATLLPTTTYQSNSGFYIQSRSTLETPTTGISAVSNIVTLSQATYDALTVKLPTTMYVIV